MPYYLSRDKLTIDTPRSELSLREFAASHRQCARGIARWRSPVPDVYLRIRTQSDYPAPGAPHG